MSYGPGFGDPNQLAQRITSNIQKITQCYTLVFRVRLIEEASFISDHEATSGGTSKLVHSSANIQAKWEDYYRDGNEILCSALVFVACVAVDVSSMHTQQQKQQYTNQLAKETDKYIKEFGSLPATSEQGGAPEDNYKEGTLVSWDSQPQAQVQDEEITEDDLRLIEERESSIRQLEADIMDINEIFKDLGMMIHEQGDVIGTIFKSTDVIFAFM
ncbi:hypothetical protein DUI87_10510 [Hirundo rustica rustica]|uniref:t-SNARE coiled-coil homology domain-containing protein n=1 Tax=Hirundo rustica rustica TaxID=333673 RepID=A0A3M0KK12_HIRRU|nr:hypothetical protein DUI87_10510 [Hirundo rustica rustica]